MPYAIVVLLILIGDQAVKLWTSQSIPVNSVPRDFIPGFIQLTNIHNSGAAFGILQNADARWFFIILAVAFVALVIWLLKNDVIKGRLGRWTLVMVMAGGIGNCLDRIISGYVVDMFSFQPKFLDWFPVFNVADIFICVCGILFCIYLLQNRDDLNDEPVKEAVQKRPARTSRRDENDRIPERGADYISQLSRPVVEGRKNIAAEKLAREIETQEPKLTVGPGDWVNPFEETKPVPEAAAPREHVNPFKEMNAAPADAANAKTAEWINPFDEPPAPSEAPTEAPAETPVEAPAEVPAKAPVEAPADAPAKAPAETPVESPAEAPVETEEAAPQATETPVSETADDLFADAKPAEPKKDDKDFSVDDIIAEFKDK